MGLKLSHKVARAKAYNLSPTVKKPKAFLLLLSFLTSYIKISDENQHLLVVYFKYKLSRRFL